MWLVDERCAITFQVIGHTIAAWRMIKQIKRFAETEKNLVLLTDFIWYPACSMGWTLSIIHINSIKRYLLSMRNGGTLLLYLFLYIPAVILDCFLSSPFFFFWVISHPQVSWPRAIMHAKEVSDVLFLQKALLLSETCYKRQSWEH